MNSKINNETGTACHFTCWIPFWNWFFSMFVMVPLCLWGLAGIFFGLDRMEEYSRFVGYGFRDFASGPWDHSGPGRYSNCPPAVGFILGPLLLCGPLALIILQCYCCCNSCSVWSKIERFHKENRDDPEAHSDPVIYRDGMPIWPKPH